MMNMLTDLAALCTFQILHRPFKLPAKNNLIVRLTAHCDMSSGRV